MTKTNFIHKLTKRAQVDTETRTVRFVLSTSTPDRVADSINPNGWELRNYLNNPVVLWGHNHDIPAIATMRNLGLEGGDLVGDVQFATSEQHEFADTVFRLVSGGIINAGSVGFMPLEWSYDEQRGGFNFERQELLEYSIVNVPMNPDALRRSLKSAGIEPEEFEALENMPAAHIPDFRQQLIDESAAERVKRSVGRLKLRAAASIARVKVSK